MRACALASTNMCMRTCAHVLPHACQCLCGLCGVYNYYVCLCVIRKLRYYTSYAIPVRVVWSTMSKVTAGIKAMLPLQIENSRLEAKEWWTTHQAPVEKLTLCVCVFAYRAAQVTLHILHKLPCTYCTSYPAHTAQVTLHILQKLPCTYCKSYPAHTAQITLHILHK